MTKRLLLLALAAVVLVAASTAGPAAAGKTRPTSFSPSSSRSPCWIRPSGSRRSPVEASSAEADLELLGDAGYASRRCRSTGSRHGDGLAPERARAARPPAGLASRRLLRRRRRSRPRRLRPAREAGRQDRAPVLVPLRVQLLEPPVPGQRPRLAGPRGRLGGRHDRARRGARARRGRLQPALRRRAAAVGDGAEGARLRSPARLRRHGLAREPFAPGTHPIDLACYPQQAVDFFHAFGVTPLDVNVPGATLGPETTAIERVHDNKPHWLRFPGTWGETQYVHAPAPLGTLPFGTSPVGPGVPGRVGRPARHYRRLPGRLTQRTVAEATRRP